jgi:CRP-like cAMP-binding protein
MVEPYKSILKNLIDKYHKINARSLGMIMENCSIKQLKKDEYLTKEGKTDSHEYFLLEGLLQRNILNDKGEMITTGFYLEETVLTPHFARTINKKSIFNIQALTDVRIAVLPVLILDSLRYSYDDIRSFGLRAVEKELMNTLSHEMSYRSKNAKDRLLNFRDAFPNLENRIPHTIIASYLGITPVSFSRLRNELAKH